MPSHYSRYAMEVETGIWARAILQVRVALRQHQKAGAKKEQFHKMDWQEVVTKAPSAQEAQAVVAEWKAKAAPLSTIAEALMPETTLRAARQEADSSDESSASSSPSSSSSSSVPPPPMLAPPVVVSSTPAPAPQAQPNVPLLVIATQDSQVETEKEKSVAQPLSALWTELQGPQAAARQILTSWQE